ncbi:MAG: class I SAM-dependent methyltransferase [Candidatus Nitrosoglobus sp.]|jgi:SAM-dependent methyltransferase
MTFDNYGSFWNQQAQTKEGAIAAVDGSIGENIVQLTGQWSARLVREALCLKGAERVLELGCGVGRIGRELAPHCGYWQGVDISSNMLEVARERLVGQENTGLCRLRRTSLEMFEDGSFDCAYSIAVFCHLDKEDLFLYLKELYRILNQNSLIYVETWNLAHPVGWRRWELEVSNWARSDHSKRKDVARNQFCSPEEFSLYIQGAGLKTIACYTHSPWIQVIAAKDTAKLDIDAIKIALSAKEDKIAYSPLFSELFDGLLEVVSGSKHPKDYLEFLDTKALSEEVSMYRRYLLAFWSSKENLWGPLPPS